MFNQKYLSILIVQLLMTTLFCVFSQIGQATPNCGSLAGRYYNTTGGGSNPEYNSAHGYVWKSQESKNIDITWSEAEALCNACGGRLPTIDEMHYLAVETSHCRNFSGTGGTPPTAVTTSQTHGYMIHTQYNNCPDGTTSPGATGSRPRPYPTNAHLYDTFAVCIFQAPGDFVDSGLRYSLEGIVYKIAAFPYEPADGAFVKMFINGEDIYIALVDVNDPLASQMKTMTPDGIKAFRLFEE